MPDMSNEKENFIHVIILTCYYNIITLYNNACITIHALKRLHALFSLW